MTLTIQTRVRRLLLTIVLLALLALPSYRLSAMSDYAGAGVVHAGAIEGIACTGGSQGGCGGG